MIIYENRVERRTPAGGKRAMIKGPSDEEKRLNYNEETLLNENEEDDAPDEPRWKRKITITISSHCVPFEGTSHDKSVRRSGCEMEKLSLFVAWKDLGRRLRQCKKGEISFCVHLIMSLFIPAGLCERKKAIAVGKGLRKRGAGRRKRLCGMNKIMMMRLVLRGVAIF